LRNPPTKPRRTLPQYFKIGEVATMVGMSATMLRSWERLGLIRPVRTDSSYRLYTGDDVARLKQARYLRKVRGLNAVAIAAQLGTSRDGKRRNGTPAAARDSIGPRLRQARLSTGKSLAEVAKAAEISVGFLSAIERSNMSASVGTLRKLARFHGMNVLDLFEHEDSTHPVVRKNERKALSGGPGVNMELLARGHTVLEPHLFRVAPGRGSGSAYTHEGEEFMFLLQGELEMQLGGEKYRLRAGDSMNFQSSTPHEWHNPGRKETLILWVNTPPTF
jgi:DNA-binding transcriptional MerR regulator/mannose-6-phosphate isomerase-like protein (cupin superfamily)